MSRRGGAGGWLRAFVRAAVCLVTLGCASGSASPPPPAATAPVEPSSPRPVRVAEVGLAESAGGFPSALYLERDVWLSARATGIIEKVLVDRGRRVRGGEPLVVLETDLREGELRIAEQNLRLAQAEHERTSSLFAQKVVSPTDALRAEIARDLAQRELELARARLERCTLRAPFDGTIVERAAVPGQRVVEDDNTGLVRIQGDDRPRARVHVPEEALADLANGDAARIEGSAGTGSSAIAARVVFVSPTIDAASGTATVIVEATAATAGLRPGSAVRVRFSGESVAAPAQTIPRDALAAGIEPGATVALLVARDGLATRREVEVLALGGLQAEVRGLAPGDLVILDRGVVAGDRVEIRGGR